MYRQMSVLEEIKILAYDLGLKTEHAEKQLNHFITRYHMKQFELEGV
jgi:ABC-type uncharacterized transport system ATPase subunit